MKKNSFLILWFLLPFSSGIFCKTLTDTVNIPIDNFDLYQDKKGMHSFLESIEHNVQQLLTKVNVRNKAIAFKTFSYINQKEVTDTNEETQNERFQSNNPPVILNIEAVKDIHAVYGIALKCEWMNTNDKLMPGATRIFIIKNHLIDPQLKAGQMYFKELSLVDDFENYTENGFILKNNPDFTVGTFFIKVHIINTHKFEENKAKLMIINFGKPLIDQIQIDYENHTISTIISDIGTPFNSLKFDFNGDYRINRINRSSAEFIAEFDEKKPHDYILTVKDLAGNVTVKNLFAEK
jgi:hypothetical protein